MEVIQDLVSTEKRKGNVELAQELTNTWNGKPVNFEVIQGK